MSTILKSKSKDAATNNPSRMIHISLLCSPHVALCGAPLLGIRYPDGTPTECVVCAELDRER